VVVVLVALLELPMLEPLELLTRAEVLVVVLELGQTQSLVLMAALVL
jgi:hypothetical protein